MQNPHETDAVAGASTQFIRVNREITCLASGRLLTDGSKKDHLVIGTSSSAQAYDCERNRDLFFADLPDGANGDMNPLRRLLARPR